MNVGMTGTRGLLTTAQREIFKSQILRIADLGIFHHGGCVGADKYCHTLFFSSLQRFFPKTQIVVHPASNEYSQYWAQDWTNTCNTDRLTVMEPHKPLTRNKHIVLLSDFMYALPSSQHELHRGSGTWATIRIARQHKRPGLIIYPNGIVSPIESSLKEV